MSNEHEFECEFDQDPNRGIMYRFYASWFKPGPLQIGMKGGPAYAQEKTYADLQISSLHAARFAAFIVRHLPDDLRNIVRAELMSDCPACAKCLKLAEHRKFIEENKCIKCGNTCENPCKCFARPLIKVGDSVVIDYGSVRLHGDVLELRYENTNRFGTQTGEALCRYYTDQGLVEKWFDIYHVEKR